MIHAGVRPTVCRSSRDIEDVSSPVTLACVRPAPAPRFVIQPAEIAREDFLEGCCSPRTATGIEVGGREQEGKHVRTPLLEASLCACSDDSACCNRLVSPTIPTHRIPGSESGQTDEGCGLFPSRPNWIATSPPACPQFSVIPPTSQSEIDHFLDLTQNLQESPYGDYLERKYRAISNQVVRAPSMLPTRLDFADSGTGPMPSSVAKCDLELGLFLTEKPTTIQDLDNPDEYAPIDLARTSTTEIYNSLIALDSPLQETIGCDGNLASSTDARVRQASIDHDESGQDDALFEPFLVESGEIFSADERAKAVENPPVLALQPQVSLDLFRLFHHDAGSTEHIMNFDSVTGMLLWQQNCELWDESDVVQNHRQLTVFPTDASQLGKGNNTSKRDFNVKPSARLCKNQASQVTTTGALKRGTVGCADIPKPGLPPTDRQGSAFAAVPVIVDTFSLISAKIGGEMKTTAAKKKRVNKTKKTNKHPKKPQVSTASQGKKVEDKLGESNHPLFAENVASKTNGSPLLCIVAEPPLRPPINSSSTTDEVSNKRFGQVQHKENSRGDSNEGKPASSKPELSDRNNRIWHENLKALEEFHQLYGHMVVPPNDPKNRKLFNWMKRQVR
jgi:hypothetical protein